MEEGWGSLGVWFDFYIFFWVFLGFFVGLWNVINLGFF